MDPSECRDPWTRQNKGINEAVRIQEAYHIGCSMDSIIQAIWIFEFADYESDNNFKIEAPIYIYI